MAKQTRQLVLQQLDQKINTLKAAVSVPPPGRGWIHGVRTALNMTLEQLATKMSITPQSLQDFEKREKQGTITLRSLQQVARALDLQFVYGFVPAEGTLEDKVKAKAIEKAQEIVNRTAQTMELEDQGNEKDQLLKAFTDKKNELMQEIPKFLWD
jgi:predicted DNA-binding mobile mystery protein A